MAGTAFVPLTQHLRGFRNSDSDTIEGGGGKSLHLHISRFGAGAVLAVSTKIKILGSCIDESPKGFGSI